MGEGRVGSGSYCGDVGIIFRKKKIKGARPLVITVMMMDILRGSMDILRGVYVV